MLIATSKNAILTFTPYVDPAAAIQFQEFSEEFILDLSDVDVVETKVGNDGIFQASVVATKMEGSFSFMPTSDTLANIQILQTAVYLSGIPVSGILQVKLPSANKNFIYRDFTIVSGIIGIPLKKEADPVKIKWSSQLAVPA